MASYFDNLEDESQKRSGANFAATARDYYQGFDSRSQAIANDLLAGAPGASNNSGTKAFVNDAMAQQSKWAAFGQDALNNAQDIQSTRNRADAAIAARQAEAAAAADAAESKKQSNLFSSILGVVGKFIPG